jgi:hypothetical protein
MLEDMAIGGLREATRLCRIDIPRDDLQAITNKTVKNFNVNPGQRSAEDQIADALRLQEAAS